MKSLFEFITEAGIKNQRDILCKQDGDCWITPTGNTITMFPIAASTNKHYDVVLAICDTRAPEITSGNLVISDLKNIKCMQLGQQLEVFLLGVLKNSMTMHLQKIFIRCTIRKINHRMRN